MEHCVWFLGTNLPDILVYKQVEVEMFSSIIGMYKRTLSCYAGSKAHATISI